MSLTVLFDMVIAITVGIVLASLLFMRRIARMTRLSELSAGDGRLVLRVNGPLFFAAAERIFTELLARSRLPHDRAAMGCGAGARCRRPERPAALYRRAACGQKLVITDVPFQPLKTLARARVQPIEGRLQFYPTLPEALAATGA